MRRGKKDGFHKKGEVGGGGGVVGGLPERKTLEKKKKKKEHRDGAGKRRWGKSALHNTARGATPQGRGRGEKKASSRIKSLTCKVGGHGRGEGETSWREGRRDLS